MINWRPRRQRIQKGLLTGRDTATNRRSLRDKLAGERRSHSRYQMTLPLQWKSERSAVVGVGVLRDISTSGLSFTSNAHLSVGTVVQISIDWPVRLAGMQRLALMVKGRVLRQDKHGIAVRLQRYEFATPKSERSLELVSER
jgi:hypothetical protein